MKYRQRLATLFVTAAISVGLAMTAGPASAASTIVTIENYGSGLCIQPSPANPGSIGVQLTQEPCNGSNNSQKWAVNSLGSGNYQFVNLATGGCMDAHGPNADRTPIDTWPCSSISNERWHFSPAIPNALPAQVVSAIGSRCMDVRGGGGLAGTPIQIYHCTSDNAAQAWLLIAVGG